MSKIEELKARKKWLIAQKQNEEALMAEGKGDNFSMFMINEEILSINAQLRQLMPQHSIGKRRTTNTEYSVDHQQYLNWKQEDEHPEEDMSDERKHQIELMQQAISNLSQKQYTVLKMNESGLTATEIADKLGVNKSTVSRNLNRAKRRVRDDVNRALQAEKILDNGKAVDMANPDIMKALLEELTPKQIVYIYLYYSEYLSLQEIEDLLGTDKSSILRTIRRGLTNIGRIFGNSEVVLQNADMLDDMACRMYYLIQDELDLPESYKIQKVPNPKGQKKGTYHDPLRDYPPIRFRIFTGKLLDSQFRIRWSTMRNIKGRGKLLSLLLERKKSLLKGAEEEEKTQSTLFYWLVKIFSKFTNKREKQFSES